MLCRGTSTPAASGNGQCQTYDGAGLGSKLVKIFNDCRSEAPEAQRMQAPRYPGLGKGTWLLVLISCGVAHYFPETWVGRNIGFFVLGFGFIAYAAIANAIEDTHREIDKITVRLDNVSSELKDTDRGLENVHDRLWKVEHKHDDPWS
jgi:hypothetical protein